MESLLELVGYHYTCFLSSLLTYYWRADHLVGGDNNLAVILGRYTPEHGNVQCSTNRKRFISGCRDILSGIPVSTVELLFGRKGDPEIDVSLPTSTQSRKSISQIQSGRHVPED